MIGFTVGAKRWVGRLKVDGAPKLQFTPLLLGAFALPPLSAYAYRLNAYAYRVHFYRIYGLARK